MNTLSVRLPESLHKGLKDAARKEGVSMNRIISAAVGEKLAALMTQDYLEARAQRASREKYEAALAQVSDADPADYDRIED